MDWKSCKDKELVKEVKVDKNLMNSLIKSSENKISTQDMIKLNDVTASSKISLMYDSLRELLEALAISKGYKIYNHECYCSFLKEVLNESNLGDQFDRFRKIRNAINYYGKDISSKEAEPILHDIIKMIEKINKILVE